MFREFSLLDLDLVCIIKALIFRLYTRSFVSLEYRYHV